MQKDYDPQVARDKVEPLIERQADLVTWRPSLLQNREFYALDTDKIDKVILALSYLTLN